jgi:transglutaminase-like putative cysteine protease
MKRLLLTLCLTTALHSQQPTAAPHTFTSTDGRKLTASIIEKTATTVTLRRAEDGKDFILQMDRLSAADQALVKAWGTKVVVAAVAAPPVALAKPLGRAAVTISNPTEFQISMTTTFVVPAGNDRIDRVRVYHALPTVMPWGLSEPRFGAANLVFTPPNAVITHHESTDSYHLLWTLEGQQKPGTRSTYTTKMTIKSADRNVGTEAEKITWSDYDTPTEDKAARVKPSVAKKVHPGLVGVAAKIRADNPPAAAVKKICEWIVDNIKYDASVPYGSGSADVVSIMQNKKGHCGHQAAIFRQLTASAGIPMRTVRGLNLYSPDGRKGRLQAVRVDWTNIHTWTEVYLPTVGWVEADPAHGLNAFAIPAKYVQNNRMFQNYMIRLREGGVDKYPEWKPREGGFSSDYGVENIIDYSSKPAVD